MKLGIFPQSDNSYCGRIYYTTGEETKNYNSEQHTNFAQGAIPELRGWIGRLHDRRSVSDFQLWAAQFQNHQIPTLIGTKDTILARSELNRWISKASALIYSLVVDWAQFTNKISKASGFSQAYVKKLFLWLVPWKLLKLHTARCLVHFLLLFFVGIWWNDHDFALLSEAQLRRLQESDELSRGSPQN